MPHAAGIVAAMCSQIFILAFRHYLAVSQPFPLQHTYMYANFHRILNRAVVLAYYWPLEYLHILHLHVYTVCYPIHPKLPYGTVPLLYSYTIATPYLPSRTLVVLLPYGFHTQTLLYGYLSIPYVYFSIPIAALYCTLPLLCTLSALYHYPSMFACLTMTHSSLSL